jgi:hypothetical protein
MKIKIIKSTAIISLLIILCSNIALGADFNNHWASETINSFVSKGYVSDDLDKSALNSPITKGELAKLTNRYYSFDESDSLEKAIDVANQNGYLKNAMANDLVSREEACAILARLTNVDLNSEQCPFSDSDDISSWALPYVSAIASNDIVVGYPDGTFKPKKNLSFAEYVVMLSRIKGSGGADSIGELELIDDDIDDIMVGILEHSGDAIKIKIINDSLELCSGDKVQMSVELPKESQDSDLSIEVENQMIASFDKDFSILTALHDGSTKISFNTNDDKYHKEIIINVK